MKKWLRNLVKRSRKRWHVDSDNSHIYLLVVTIGGNYVAAIERAQKRLWFHFGVQAFASALLQL